MSKQMIALSLLFWTSRATASDVELWHQVDRTSVSLGVVTSESDMSVHRLQVRAKKYLNKYRKAKFIQVFVSSFKPCLLPDIRSAHESKPTSALILQTRASACPNPVAELMSIYGNAALRVAENGSLTKHIVLVGRDPFYIRYPDKQAQIVLVAPMSSTLLRMPSGKKKVFLKVAKELMNLEAVQGLYREIRDQLPFDSVTVIYRTDECFWGDLVFPIAFPFATMSLDMIGNYTSMPEARCLTDISGRLSCWFSGRKGQPK